MTARGFWDDGDGIDAAFHRFHQAHPEVMSHLVRLCRQWVSAGRGRWSIKGAFEVLRWERKIAGLPDPVEDFKLNNNYHSRYARLLMQDNDDFDGLFELRELHS